MLWPTELRRLAASAFFVSADFVTKLTVTTFEVDPVGVAGLPLGIVVLTLGGHLHYSSISETPHISVRGFAV